MLMLKFFYFHKKVFLLILAISIAWLWTTSAYAQTIKSYIDHEWSDSRYIDHGDGTVTDRRTNLMWKKCSEGLSGDRCDQGSIIENYTWFQALEHAANHHYASKNDWRIPNVKELFTLVAFDRSNPTINSQLFPNTVSSLYISSSLLRSANDTDIRTISFRDGNDQNWREDGAEYSVRLVRDGELF